MKKRMLACGLIAALFVQVAVAQERSARARSRSNYRRRRVLAAASGAVLILVVAARLAAAQQEPIDWNKARELHQRAQRGETLTAEEEAYYDRAKAARQKRSGRAGQARQPGARSRPGAPPARESTGLIPLVDMSADGRYRGEDGGLYGGGSNVPPESHLQAALAEAEKIQPLDAEGRPDPDGKIVLISNGMSNTTQEFSAFIQVARDDPHKSKHVVIVDCAFGGQDVADWADPEGRFRKDRPNPWDQQMAALRKAGVSPLQVQAAWIKHARRGPASFGEFPKHAEEMKQHSAVVLNKLRERFPNLRLAYLSSRIYAGYAGTPLNPEPYAYETAFVVRWLIRDQIRGEPSLNPDPARGEVRAPLLLWGPYLWADGVKGRKADDLVWLRDDLAGDGTHPSQSGRAKVAAQLLQFFKTDPTAKPWFVRED